jgi:alanyl-tRNA synthetase
LPINAFLCFSVHKTCNNIIEKRSNNIIQLMTANEIRSLFLEFFAKKQHEIVASAPMVVKNDPTLMFTNAGMNQFKDLFLGNSAIVHKRIADSQKCLRVSGKHNDLEEVGHDTYHHTMFEMLGNWSFGDYFKAESIDWAWEFLVEVMGISKDCIYATVFEGDKADGTELDSEAKQLWLKYLPEDRVLYGNKKDNFWEMGDTGPCGPCSEIHVDIRSAEEKAAKPGRELVNESHPQVIEIWNLVFIQYNRKASGQLELLPAKHVDTGMGFERLCMVAQGKQSNYDTDVFSPLLNAIGKISGIAYGNSEKTDIAMRVIADHLRTISFAIADGQLPSNNKAGYVIRRILRRAVRYGYTFLGQSQPFMCKLVPSLCGAMGAAYPELIAQLQLIEKVIQEEEASFLRTLDTGIGLLDSLIAQVKKQRSQEIPGNEAFLLYDTYGFPFDLTELIARENGFTVDKAGFEAELEIQKNRSRQATATQAGDWHIVLDTAQEFVGYDSLQAECRIARYRKVAAGKKEIFHIVLDKTPFYAESGGQAGDKGYLAWSNGKLQITDTVKENNLSLHIADNLPDNLEAVFTAQVNVSERRLAEANHTATHLLHKALRDILGTHVEQKGSLVCPGYLRFDFAHFQKLTEAELQETEKLVNAMIRSNIALEEYRELNIKDAEAMGAMALFGEKYGENVRVIRFSDSIELCGGTHASSTGQIGLFKIVSESAIAAGIRRIEAITADAAENFVLEQQQMLAQIKDMLKGTDPVKGIAALQDANAALSKKLESLSKAKADELFKSLSGTAQQIGDALYIGGVIELDDQAAIKDLAFRLKSIPGAFVALGAECEGKANLTIALSDKLVANGRMDAGKIVRECAKHIQGGGGGQPFYATAGGKQASGLADAIEHARTFLG